MRKLDAGDGVTAFVTDEPVPLWGLAPYLHLAVVTREDQPWPAWGLVEVEPFRVVSSGSYRCDLANPVDVVAEPRSDYVRYLQVGAAFPGCAPFYVNRDDLENGFRELEVI